MLDHHPITRRYRLLPAALAGALLLLSSGHAQAVSVTSNIPIAGDFQATMGVSGQANLNSASGTFKQWVLFSHVNVGVSAAPQSVGVNLTSSPTIDVDGSGTANFTYDNVSPGTPQALTQGGPLALDIDINGAGGSNTNIPFNLAVSPIAINTSLGSFNLNLTVNANITDLTFQSTAGSAANPGYVVPGDLTAVLNGNVTGVLTGVPIIGSFNLGTIFTLVDAPLSFNIPLPGIASTSDLNGPPYPSDMEANFAFSLPGLSVPFPFVQPLTVALNQSVPNGQSGFSVLNVDAELDATITLSDVAYSYTGTVPNALVPEPGTAALLALGLAAVATARRRS